MTDPVADRLEKYLNQLENPHLSNAEVQVLKEKIKLLQSLQEK